MKKLVAAVIVLAGLVAAGILAEQAVEREREYRRLIVQGDEALSRGETFVAIEAYSGAIALKRGSMLAFLKRGEAHHRRGDTPETLTAALRDLRTAAELDPGATRTLEKLGDVNFQLRRYANAAESYEAYLRLDDRSATVFYKLALASRGAGRLTRAISALQQAVKLNPAFHEAHYVLGLCLKDREQLAEARAAFEQAVSTSPAFIPAREELAEIHRLQDRTRDEIQELEVLAALDPAKPERRVAVGLAHLRAGNREHAVNARCAAQPSVFRITSASMRRSVRYGSKRPRSAKIPSDVRKALEALAPLPASRPRAAKRSAFMAARSCSLDSTREAEQVFREAAQRFANRSAKSCRTYASVAQRLGHLEDARQALLKYSILVDDDRDKAAHAVRIADLSLQLNDAGNRGRRGTRNRRD